MSKAKPIHIGIIAGETSGQLLAADVIRHLKAIIDADIRLTGVGGGDLAEFGLNSFFDPEDIALTGLTSVVGQLPKLLSHLAKAANAFIKDPPDILLLVDSPDFSSRVAKRVKKRLPHMPVAKYVAPTVWAWRPERASKMVGTYDHVFALFPFEPNIMKELGGPPTTYVGHRLLNDEALMSVAKTPPNKVDDGSGLNFVFLPGSRRSEIKSLMPDMGKVIEALERRRQHFSITIPAVERHLGLIQDGIKAWNIKTVPHVVTGRPAQLEAFCNADAALAASGTVLLELALAKVPALSIYRVDPLMKPFVFMIKAWSAALPNVIADRVVISEYYDHLINPGLLARQLEEIAQPNSTKRRAIMEGYETVATNMALERPPHEAVTDVLLEMLEAPPAKKG
ncbi:MAG: lipid-A-disaccharide synthase [Pseudomonadota bacterium]